ncbi:MAG: septum formation initiator family protein [Fibromonadaceae bacterium]|jgi:cell division protein FtsB|nr:septum formation initiator family protein [Fibromonadaceae bacterium]
MLGRKKKTGAQVVQEITDSIAIKASRIGKHSLSLKFICIACIVILSASIISGLLGLNSRINDISKREQNIEELRSELQSLEAQHKNKLETKVSLKNDPLTIEAIARSYGLSKKGETVFYFLD